MLLFDSGFQAIKTIRIGGHIAVVEALREDPQGMGWFEFELELK